MEPFPRDYKQVKQDRSASRKFAKNDKQVARATSSIAVSACLLLLLLPPPHAPLPTVNARPFRGILPSCVPTRRDSMHILWRRAASASPRR